MYSIQIYGGTTLFTWFSMFNLYDTIRWFKIGRVTKAATSGNPKYKYNKHVPLQFREQLSLHDSGKISNDLLEQVF